MGKKCMFLSKVSALSMILSFIFVLSVLPRYAEAFTEDFESGAAGWITEGTWALITDDYHSPVYCMTDSPDADYLADANSAIIYQSIALPDTTPLILSFWHHYSFANFCF